MANWRANRRAAMLLFLGASALLTAAMGRRDPFSISFHVQGEANEGSMVRQDPENTALYFRTAPVITHNQMTAFYPFPSPDGFGYGAVFVLTDPGERALEIAATTDPGRLVRAVVNGQPVDYLKLDRPQGDNAIVVWRGLTAEHLKLFEEKLQRREFPR